MVMPDLPNPGDELEAELPGWSESTRDRLDPPQPATVTHPENETPAASEKDWDELDPDELDDLAREEAEREQEWFEREDQRTRPSSSRGSTEADPVVAGAFAQLAQLAVTFASLGLERTIGNGSQAFIARPEEAAAIAEPLGRIAARHAPIGEGAAGDVADGIEAGMAAAQYGMRATVEHTTSQRVPAAPEPSVDQ